MLFMGEEYGETAPFQYFTSHSDPDLIEAVRKGRHEEFDDFDWEGEPPDPHDEETFRRSKLNWQLLERDEHASLRHLYQELLRIRRETPALRRLDLATLEVEADDERASWSFAATTSSSRSTSAMKRQTVKCRSGEVGDAPAIEPRWRLRR